MKEKISTKRDIGIFFFTLWKIDLRANNKKGQSFLF